jgi:transcription elongation GreA/GreB family factor
MPRRLRAHQHVGARLSHVAVVPITAVRDFELAGAAQTGGDRYQIASARRELRYWLARRSTAEIVAPPEDTDKVRFGSRVTVVRTDGRRQSFRIVGEDEADPTRGTLSYASPLARALPQGLAPHLVP